MTSQLSPAEIYESLEKTITGYINALDGYTDEQFSYKPAEDVWSLGQMYEHLLLSANFFFLANTLRCLEQRKGQLGGEKNQYGDNLYKYNKFPPVKLKIPEVLRGPEPVAKSMDAYRIAFPKVLEDAKKLIEPVTKDAGQYKCIQPAFDWLNAHEWYHLMEMHFRHHLRQQAELEAILKG
ncbi:DinB family protein [Runella sp.]|uniref:DinB family protein n=1 Tax=Runella sp. TaxID=1960881 RepID=UPI003D09D5FC